VNAVAPRIAPAPADLPGRYWRTARALARATEAETAVGASAADAAFRRDKVTLWRHRPRAPRVDAPPLVIVHGLVGRASVTDLDPRRSLVRALLDRGHDVWLIDWGAPSRAERFLRIDDYVVDYLGACVARATGAAGRPPALLGICEGGVFAACFAALNPGAVAGLCAAVAPIDPHAAPDAILTRWVRAFDPEELARLVDVFGYLPGGLVGALFGAMTPARTMAKYTADLLAMADRPQDVRAFLRMERWLADRPHHPGAAAKQLLIGLYHRNELARGAFALDGRTVDLRAIRAPVLTVCGLRDHIVPPASALALGGLLHPETPHRAVALDAGHIGVFVSGRARGGLGAALADWLPGLA
jgi:polyhydroxyalkanoate synthase